jgi:hypothetical protein
MAEAPAGLQLADAGVQLLDATGDAQPDLLVTTPTLSGYYPLRFGGRWDRRPQPYQLAPSFNLEDSEVKLVDLDGDGVTDALRSGTSFECFFHDPAQGGWHKVERKPRRGLEEFPDVNFSDPRVKWGDLSGDGLQDIALVHDGSVVYWPSLGHGDRGGARGSRCATPRITPSATIPGASWWGTSTATAWRTSSTSTTVR